MQRDPKWSLCSWCVHPLYTRRVWSVQSRQPTRLLSFEDQDCILRVSNLVWVKKKVRKKESGGTLDHFVLFLKLGNANFPIKCGNGAQLTVWT